ncbi:MAG: DUF2306 domain-containing protein [Pseudomonadota bacterium]
MWEEMATLEAWVDSAAGMMHFFCALYALVSGPFLFVWRKRGALHRFVGFTFILAMLALNVSALTIFDLGRFNLFHLFAIISLVTLIPGMIAISQAIRRRSRLWFTIHAHCMAWTYYGLAMAGFAQIAYRTIPQFTGSFESVAAFWDIVMPVASLSTIVLTWWLIPGVVDRYAPGVRRQPKVAHA